MNSVAVTECTNPAENQASSNPRMDEGEAHNVLLLGEDILVTDGCWGKKSVNFLQRRNLLWVAPIPVHGPTPMTYWQHQRV